MSRVAYGQKGYSGASMSINAAAAYEAGERPRSRWTKPAIIDALRGYCDEWDLLYDPAVESETRAALFDRFIAYSSWHHTGAYARETEFFALDEEAVTSAFRELEPDEVAERDRIRAEAAAALCARGVHMREVELAFERRFACRPDSVMAYEAFHPERAERRKSKRGGHEVIAYRVPDPKEEGRYIERAVLADDADIACAGASVFMENPRREWRDIDFDEAARKFAAAADRAAEFRAASPKLIADECARAALRDARHRAGRLIEREEKEIRR